MTSKYCHRKTKLHVINDERGFTLLEVMVSLVILSLLMIVCTQSMGISVSDIIQKGNKARDLASAQKKLEYIYAVAEHSGSTTNEVLKVDSDYVASMAELNTFDPNKLVKFCLESVTEPVEGTKVTVMVYSKNGKHVQLTSFIAEI